MLRKSRIFKEDTYLKLGAGKPWAGQSKARLVLKDLFIVNTSDSVENEGAFELTGSNSNKKLYKNRHINTEEWWVPLLLEEVTKFKQFSNLLSNNLVLV